MEEEKKEGKHEVFVGRISLVSLTWEKRKWPYWRDEVTMGSIFLSSAKLGEGTDLVGDFEVFFIKLLFISSLFFGLKN